MKRAQAVQDIVCSADAEARSFLIFRQAVDVELWRETLRLGQLVGTEAVKCPTQLYPSAELVKNKRLKLDQFCFSSHRNI